MAAEVGGRHHAGHAGAVQHGHVVDVLARHQHHGFQHRLVLLQCQRRQRGDVGHGPRRVDAGSQHAGAQVAVGHQAEQLVALRQQDGRHALVGHAARGVEDAVGTVDLHRRAPDQAADRRRHHVARRRGGVGRRCIGAARQRRQQHRQYWLRLRRLHQRRTVDEQHLAGRDGHRVQGVAGIGGMRAGAEQLARLQRPAPAGLGVGQRHAAGQQPAQALGQLAFGQHDVVGLKGLHLRLAGQRLARAVGQGAEHTVRRHQGVYFGSLHHRYSG